MTVLIEAHLFLQISLFV